MIYRKSTLILFDKIHVKPFWNGGVFRGEKFISIVIFIRVLDPIKSLEKKMAAI